MTQALSSSTVTVTGDVRSPNEQMLVLRLAFTNGEAVDTYLNQEQAVELSDRLKKSARMRFVEVQDK